MRGEERITEYASRAVRALCLLPHSPLALNRFPELSESPERGPRAHLRRPFRQYSRVARRMVTTKDLDVLLAKIPDFATKGTTLTAHTHLGRKNLEWLWVLPSWFPSLDILHASLAGFSGQP